MRDILKTFDILNILPSLYIQKREKFSSTFGIISGFLIISFSIACLFFFIVEYFKKVDTNVVFNEISSFNPSLNMTKVPFIFKLTNTKGEFYSGRIITFTFQHWKFDKLSNGTPSITTLNYERCNKTKHFQNYENFFYNIYEQMKLDTYYCLNLDNYDLTINGLWGDLINGYSLINLYINECINNTKTNKTDCLPKDDIMKLIGDTNMFLRISFIDFQIDHNNYTNPYYHYVRSDNIQFSYKAKARAYYYLKNVIYNTDVGYFQQQMEKDTFFQYDTFMLTYPSVTYQIPNAFGLFSFLISSKAAQYDRSFPKLQTLIANISGLINGGILVLKFILHFFSKESIFLFYLNEVFTPKFLFGEKNQENKDLKNNIFKRFGETKKKFKKSESVKNVNIIKNLEDKFDKKGVLFHNKHDKLIIKNNNNDIKINLNEKHQTQNSHYYIKSNEGLNLNMIHKDNEMVGENKLDFKKLRNMKKKKAE